ncbi:MULTISPECIES: YqiA/YcfP family alpha/beta fold hydrolase [unclassified Shewanella]|uniref:YqiA/YcfP family alpha/beta fold hydrolase n=1 Tax=unclassified Shewanella TaxID=196818 RepID=UPI000C851EBB|nr:MULTISPECIES: YqiA/YcfP family alpha/beta fold hydrolase [unclassified Shewanella]MDO6678430.1 YqiA/YcfP family alpha/beta fold hydrolase [Shewanella sp. 4_MG-2023]PMH96251.1 hypothetical protein BCU55_02755 [Shewanella sp. 10N.286.48.A6]
MNILYIHGFGSQFDETSDKINLLNTIGSVVGITIDYTKSSESIEKALKEFSSQESIDLIVGTSLGGYWANRIGSKIGVPFVSINPAISPKTSLAKYVGQGITYFGEPYLLTKEVIENYSDFLLEGCGLILVDLADEVLSADKTIEMLGSRFGVMSFEGGNHRFAHLQESLGEIKNFYHISELVYGL